MFKVEGKKDVLMLSTIHEAIFVKTGKVGRDGNKIEKPEAVYYYCSLWVGWILVINFQITSVF